MGSTDRISVLLFVLLCVNLSFARKFFYEHQAHHSALHSRQGMSRSVGSEPDAGWANKRQDFAQEPPKGGSDPQDFGLGVVVEEPDQPDEVAYFQRLAASRSIESEPDPDEPDRHRSGRANKWTSRQVIAHEEPPKGGSDPQDFGLGVVVEEPDHPDEAAYYQNLAASHSVGSEPDPDQPDRRNSKGQFIAEEPPKGGSDPQDLGSVVLGASPVPPAPPLRDFFYPYGIGSVAYYQQVAGPEGHGFGHVLGEESRPPPNGMED